MAGDGLVSLAPSSVSYTGTNATINADGGVDLDAVTIISVNGVFSSSYVNYLMVISGDTVSNTGVEFRLRASGTDDSTASSYVRVYLAGNDTTESSIRSTDSLGNISPIGGISDGSQTVLFAPGLASPTAWRAWGSYSSLGARFQDQVNTHNQSTAYDGFTITVGSAFTGSLHVFGYEE